MEPTVWISVAGLASTVAASAIGFYFSQKSQRSPLRQELYKKQVEYLTEFVVQATRLQMLAASYKVGSHTFEEGSEVEQAWETLAEGLRDITQRAGVVMPAAAYSTMTAYRAAQNDFEDALIAKKELQGPLQALAGALGHVFMVGREVLGADNLSAESIRLHSTKGYETMNRMGAKALGKVYAALWQRGKVPLDEASQVTPSK